MQQMRWAYGTIGIFKKLLKELFRHPRRLTPVQWWEYFLSGTWYFVGWAFFFMMLCPIAYLLFEIRPLLAEPYMYAVAYLPYLLFSSLQFFVSMSMRGFSAKDQWLGQILTYLTFPIYMLAATYALINKKIPFVVTPKGGSGKYSLTCFWPQIAMMLIIFFSVAVGIWKFVQQFDVAIIINILWSFYYLILLSMFLYFRRDAEEPSLYYVDMFEEFVRE
jgi:cellulose synthase (UDP-forming)